MKISEIYEPVPPLKKTCSIREGIDAILKANVSLLPVVDEDAGYLGVITLQGLLAACSKADAGAPAETCLETGVPLIAADSDFGDIPAAADRLVVTDAKEKVVGVITSARLVRSLLDYFFEVERMVRRTTDAEKTTSRYNVVKGLVTDLEAIINSSYDGIFITDGQGTVVRLNEAYERITGIRASEVIGKNMANLVQEGVYDQSATVLVLERRESVTVDQTVKPTNKHILVTGNPIFDEQGNIFRVVTNVRDITELTNLQKALSQTVVETLKYQTELSHLRSLQLKSAEIQFRSRAMAAVLELAAKVADVNSNVLIVGESGTGKELVAKLIHREGKGEGKPFIKINCGAIPENLLESELFGYERGAFTGARKEGKPGLFELANRGTLFLDEIGEMSPFLQVKLLRAIQEKTVTRVGGVSPVQVDVRIIAATHRNLANMVKTGKFREDLYYRLMVVPIQLPPLRERKEDIPLLAMHFIERFNKEFGFNKSVSPQVIDKLAEYSWPGNVRELENVIERMMVTTPDDELTPAALPTLIARDKLSPKAGTRLKDALDQTEKTLLAEAFQKYRSWPKTAEALGIDRTTAFRKAIKHGLIDKP
ncbi:MAG TPA: sigma 54-interacting transcriptional regulator [Selenomonadales bacterium]|nr:sigma 54-interacting transcriptional regulator [Selenomonadales bacterium]